MGKIVSQCPHCNKKFRLPQEKIGKKVKCPNCAEIFTIEEFKTNQEVNKTQTYQSSDSSKKTLTYSNSAQENKTQTYSDSQNFPKTQTYSDSESEPAYIYDLTQIYGSSSNFSGGLTITTTHNLTIGDVVVLNDASYTITGIISEGTGEAVIYTIQDSSDDIFALKLYFEFPNPKDEPNPKALERIKQINDPDILRLYDFGTGINKYQGKYCFEICDFARGGNLVGQNYDSLDFIIGTIIPQMFNGIQTLHKHKIYHCDLKPENIFWLDAEHSDLVIGDYGSAKTFEETSQKHLTHTSTTKGTNFYLAPEQPRGIVSAKNDYYSFGMILLHLLYPQYVTHEYLHKIIERQYERKPIIDYKPEYREK